MPVQERKPFKSNSYHMFDYRWKRGEWSRKRDEMKRRGAKEGEIYKGLPRELVAVVLTIKWGGRERAYLGKRRKSEARDRLND